MFFDIEADVTGVGEGSVEIIALNDKPYLASMFRKRLESPGKALQRRTLKPIFHCDAKPFALGPCVGLDPLGIPTCW